MRLPEKRCSKCGEVKAFASFSRCASNTDGLQRWCKDCITVGRLVRARRIVSPTEKTCKDCGRLKPIRAFNRSGVSRDGHQARCYECHKARYYEGQRERARLAYRTDAGWVRAALSAARRRAARDGVPFDLVEADV